MGTAIPLWEGYYAKTGKLALKVVSGELDMPRIKQKSSKPGDCSRGQRTSNHLRWEASWRSSSGGMSLQDPYFNFQAAHSSLLPDNK